MHPARHQRRAGDLGAPGLHADRVLVAGGEDLVTGAQAGHPFGDQFRPDRGVAVDGELFGLGSHQSRQLRDGDLVVVAPVVDLAGVRGLGEAQVAFVHGSDHRVRRDAERALFR